MSQPSFDDRSSGPVAELEKLRESLRRKSGTTIEHELPGLINVIQTQEIASDETVRYIVGVSFTARQTGFDYWIDTVVVPHERSEYRTRTVKEAIEPDHQYVTFLYPPDPQFNGEVLRGILLSRLESRLHSTATPEDEPDDSGGVERVTHAIAAGYRAFWTELRA